MGGEEMKITILTPTFNDARFIPYMLRSVLEQSYQNWELLIVDDASTDDTPSVVSPFLKDTRIKYFYQKENRDQLCALYQVVPYITGDIVTLLHSDDLFLDKEALSRIVSYFRDDQSLDGIYADLCLVDEDGRIKGILRSTEVVNETTVMRAFLALGANIVTDVFCVRRRVFFDQVVKNYLLWNTFYWVKLSEDRIGVLNLRKVSPWYKYRQGDNYLSRANEARQAFVLSGCYRTIVELGYYYRVKKLWTALSSLPKVRRAIQWWPGYFCSRVRNALYEEVVLSLAANSCLLKKLLKSSQIEHPLIQRVFEIPVEYMRNLSRNTIILDLDNAVFDGLTDEQLFFGKDSRRFFELIMSGQNIPRIYQFFLEKAPQTQAVRVEKRQVEVVRNILRFLCLPIPILVDNEDNTPEALLEGFRRRFSWV